MTHHIDIDSLVLYSSSHTAGPPRRDGRSTTELSPQVARRAPPSPGHAGGPITRTGGSAP